MNQSIIKVASPVKVMLSAGNYNAWIKMLSNHFKTAEVSRHVKSITFAKDDFINLDKQTPRDTTPAPAMSYLDRELARQKTVWDAAFNEAYPGADSMTDRSSKMKVAEKKLAFNAAIDKDLVS